MSSAGNSPGRPRGVVEGARDAVSVRPGLSPVGVSIALAVTWWLTGLIWVVQVVQYPGFAAVDPGTFPVFHALHSDRITWLVAGPMLVEAALAVALFVRPPRGVHRAEAAILLLLVGVIWASTAFLQVPEHERLADGLDQDSVRRLVATNWVRTVAWSLRAIGLAWLAPRVWRAG
ncbi:MAG: hypothetical protein KC591_02830 [Gemmatimonadetes bacterium]|nr:hypothetical protein [Gemmatimonadota bacterium]